MNRTRNLLDQLPAVLPAEQFDLLSANGSVRIERIVSRGHTTPAGEWLQQPWEEWVLVVCGAAQLLFKGEPAPRHMASGDYVVIPAGCRHRVAWTDPDRTTVWLAVHSGQPGPA